MLCGSGFGMKGIVGQNPCKGFDIASALPVGQKSLVFLPKDGGTAKGFHPT